MSNMCMCQVRDWRKNEWDYDAKNDNCRKFARNLDELIKKWYDDYLKSLEGED